MQKRFLFLTLIAVVGLVGNTARAEESDTMTTPAKSSAIGIASSAYVRQIVGALNVPVISEKLTAHIENTENPHSVTAAQVGLGNVKDVDTTNADNLVSGTVNIARLPVGMTDGMVASGGDTRFDTLSTSEPAGTPPTGRVYVWFN